MSPSGPRRLGDWLLRVLLPPGMVGRAVRGDLVEEYGQLPGGLRTDLRYCLSALALALTYGVSLRVDGLRRLCGAVGGDIELALRRTWDRKAQSFVFVLTLGSAIAANTILFSVVNAILIRPLPFTSGADLRQVVVADATGHREARASLRDLVDIRSAPDVVASAGWHGWAPALSGPELASERLAGLAVTDGFFELFDLEASIGRVFVDSDFADRRLDVVVLAHGFWQRAMGADRSVVGGRVWLNGQSRLVVGVGPDWLPSTFPGIGRVDFWVPTEYPIATTASLPPRTRGKLSVGVRFASGIGEADGARVLMRAIRLDEHERSDPAIAGRSFYAPTLHSLVTGDFSRTLWYFQVTMACVLMIALVNLGGVLVASCAERRGEIAVRLALGGTTAQIVGMLGAECAVLATLGGALGLLLTVGGLPLVAAAARDAIPPGFVVSLQPIVLVVTFGLTALCAIGLASVQANAARGRSAARALNALARSPARSDAGRVRDAFAVAQIALSFAIVVTAVLLTKTYIVLVHRDAGADERVIGIRVDALSARFPTVASQRAFYAELVQRVARLPGVGAVGSVNNAHFSGTPACVRLRSEADPERFRNGGPCAELRAISANYFEVAGIRLHTGRSFTVADHPAGEAVAVVSEETARLLWPAQDPVGKRFAYGDGDDWIRVVGVVAPVTRTDPIEGSAYQIYRPLDQWHSNARTLVVRPTARSGAHIVQGIRDVVRALDPGVPVEGIGTLAERRSATLATERFRAGVLASAAAIVMLLVMAGLFGVVSSAAVKKRREMAVRITLGAAAGTIVTTVLGGVLRITLIGLTIGAVCAAAAGSAFLPTPVELYDRASFAATIVLFIALTLITAGLPAARLTRIDPMTVMRESDV